MIAAGLTTDSPGLAALSSATKAMFYCVSVAGAKTHGRNLQDTITDPLMLSMRPSRAAIAASGLSLSRLVKAR